MTLITSPRLGILIAAIWTSCGDLGCGAGQIFGPGSVIPTDLQTEANCVATQLIGGDTNVVQIAVACSVPEDQTLADLVSWLVKSLGAKGKLTPAQVQAATDSVTTFRAAHAPR